MRFFVPHADSEEAESVYEGFARWCGVDVPPPDRAGRVDRIHARRRAMDGHSRRPVAWVDDEAPKAEGGDGGRHDAAIRSCHRPAVFAGDPYLVVTNARLTHRPVSGWANPFFAGRPTSARYFEPEGAADA